MNRRQMLRTVAGTFAISCAPTLLLPSKSWANNVRPDQVISDFWQVPREVNIVNAKSKKRAVVRFWDGAYLANGYSELCYLLEDNHEHIAVQMQMGLFDLIYATQKWYALSTGNQPVTEITSGYRTYRTNALVGGSPSSFHPRGAALDGRLLGVSLTTYAAMLMKFGSGGIGLYDRHVHWDVGRSPIFWRGSSYEM